MNRKFKQFLMNLIRWNYISVFNDENGSEYSIPAGDIEAFVAPTDALHINPNDLNQMETLETNDFIISCQYIVDGITPSGLYRLEYGGMTLESAITPILSKPASQVARDLIDLAHACSRKIIAQQKMAEQRNMIMGMSNNYASHTN